MIFLLTDNTCASERRDFRIGGLRTLSQTPGPLSNGGRDRAKFPLWCRHLKPDLLLTPAHEKHGAERGSRREGKREKPQVGERNKTGAVFRDFQHARRKRAHAAAPTSAFSLLIGLLAVLPCPEPSANPYATFATGTTVLPLA